MVPGPPPLAMVVLVSTGGINPGSALALGVAKEPPAAQLPPDGNKEPHGHKPMRVKMLGGV